MNTQPYYYQENNCQLTIVLMFANYNQFQDKHQALTLQEASQDLNQYLLHWIKPMAMQLTTTTILIHQYGKRFGTTSYTL